MTNWVSDSASGKGTVRAVAGWHWSANLQTHLVLEQVQALTLRKDFMTLRARDCFVVCNLQWPCQCARDRSLHAALSQDKGLMKSNEGVQHCSYKLAHT